MTFHAAAYAAASSTAGNVPLTPALDDELTIRGTGYFLTEPWQVPFVFATGNTLIQALLVSPTLRRVTPPDLFPLNGTLIPGDDSNIVDYRGNPFQLAENESLEVLHDDSAGTTVDAAIVGLSKRHIPAPAGRIWTIRATLVGTAVAITWTALTATFTEDLPNGRYAVVGLDCFGATSICMRMIFKGQNERPGCICKTNAEMRAPLMFGKGRLGMWGEFDNQSFPNFEVFASAGDTAQTILMDIVKIS